MAETFKDLVAQLEKRKKLAEDKEVDLSGVQALDEKLKAQGVGEKYIGFKRLLDSTADALNKGAPVAPPDKQAKHQPVDDKRQAFRAAFDTARQENALRDSIAKKIRYSETSDGTPIIGSSAGLVPLKKLGIEGVPGKVALGINADDLTDDEMAWLIRRHEQNKS